MGQDYYLLSETDYERLRGFSESFYLMFSEFLDSRKIKTPPWEEDNDLPEYKNFQSNYEELDSLAQEKFDF